MTRRLLAMSAAAFGVLVFSSTASAATLGIAAPPSGATATSCTSAVIGQYTADPSTPYFVPAGGGEITQWQTYTAGDTPGGSLTFAVVRPVSGGYTVVGADTVTLPNPLPTNNIASFTLSSPIQVAAGDTLALYSTSQICYFDAGSTPSGDALFAATAATYPPSTGESLTLLGPSPGGYTLDLEATLVQQEDASVQSSMFPSTTDVAGAALLRSVVTNGGPGSGPITFVDQVPSGLRIDSASAGSGTCAVSGQTVTCTITGLSAGQNTSVNIVLASTKAGTYANQVTVNVAPGVTDPNSANNTASASLVVTSLPQQCVVPGLRKMPMASARTLLKELGCGVRFARQHSNLKTGLVIGVRGGVSTYPYKHLVTVIVSSGKKKKK